MELFVFDIFTLLLIKIDMDKYEKQITPLTIIALVYTILINLNNLIISNIYGFFKVENYVLGMMAVFFILIFMIDITFGYLYRHTKRIEANFSVRFKSYKGVTFLFLIGVMAYSIQFVRLYASNGLNIKGGNNGILGHLSSFAYILGPVSLDLALKTKKKFNVFFSATLNVLVFLISVLFGGKYVIFINLTYFLLYFILKRDNRVSIGKIVKLALPLAMVAIGVFIVLYYIIPRITGRYQSTIYFAMQHMFEYLLGPVIANNYTIAHAGQGDFLIPFAVFINIGKAFMRAGNYVNPIYHFLFPIFGINKTNVSGIFGESIYDLGYVGAILYILILFIVINVFFYLYRARNKYYLSFCYSTSMIAFLFFCNYISVSGVLLPLILAFMLDAFSLCRVGDYHI